MRPRLEECPSGTRLLESMSQTCQEGKAEKLPSHQQIRIFFLMGMLDHFCINLDTPPKILNSDQIRSENAPVGQGAMWGG